MNFLHLKFWVVVDSLYFYEDGQIAKHFENKHFSSVQEFSWCG